jgi:CyaY protein
MNESDFHRDVDAVLARIEAGVEASDALDVDLESGILTVTCPDGSRVIVNRQTPNREIWVAARSGGFHYRKVGGEWRDTRAGDELFDALARIIASQCGEKVAFE